MPNVTWLEPQNMVDILALNLIGVKNGMRIPGDLHIAILSPWISNIELQIGASAWHKRITIGHRERRIYLLHCLKQFLEASWAVDIGVLQYGDNYSASGLRKAWDSYAHERIFLNELRAHGAGIYLCANQHAKGIVTPLGCVTGSTNYTKSGMYLQSQNANYFPHSNPDYPSNCAQLLANIKDLDPYTGVLV